MPIYTKESLETLRQRIDLVEVLRSHLEIKSAGSAYKALCPFHDEKTPSFTIQKGDHHYHCYGCGAHGDAIQFLMTHVKMSFMESVDSLAQRFNVILEHAEKSTEVQGPNKSALKEALEHACQMYHFLLLQSVEGQNALKYLYSRGIDLDFIRHFRLGLASKTPGILRQYMQGRSVKEATLIDAGLVTQLPSGGLREFFADRILFPIHDAQGAVIAFSGRKYREETFGGKYVNTAETALFKKSKVLFGLNYCRKRIAKERQVLIVEGQIDALRLIDKGLDFTVASQGTAFGESHAKELINLGVREVFIATDADEAGREAACKIGNFFQREGIEVLVVNLPEGKDPDSFLCEHGAKAFIKLMEERTTYLQFLVKYRSKSVSMESPAGKHQLVHAISKQISEWNHPLMVHESLRQLAQLAQVPEGTLGIGQEHIPNLYIKKSATVGSFSVDADRILEFDALRWLILYGNVHTQLVKIAKNNLKVQDFRVLICQLIYQAYLQCFEQGTCDLLSLAAILDDTEAQKGLEEILQRKVNKERAEQHFVETIQRILDRNWMEQREQIRVKIQDGRCSDEEALELSKSFDELRRSPPKVNIS